MPPGILEVRVSPFPAPGSREARCCSNLLCTIVTNRLIGEALDEIVLVLRVVFGKGKLEALEGGGCSDAD
jgi:hypothetical protein